MTREPVQAAVYTTGLKKADTELARTVAWHYSWTFDENDRVCAGRRVLAMTIEDAAAAMVELGWILPETSSVSWSVIPQSVNDGAVVDALAACLDSQGRYAARWM